ncbi:MAG: DUF5333 domain-containing protein [Pseudomonadota bacterium]
MVMRPLAITLLLLTLFAAPLEARSPNDVAEVRNGLLAVAVGDAIQKNCESITPRLLRVYNLRNQLFSAARAAGFSSEEIDAFVDDPIARANLRAEAEAYLSARGLEGESPAGYCAVGVAEIDQETAVGRLLRAR